MSDTRGMIYIMLEIWMARKDKFQQNEVDATSEGSSRRRTRVEVQLAFRDG